jgi:hypothetical protein
VRLTDRLHRKLGKVAEPTFLFPLIAVVLLALIWTATVELVGLKRADTEHVAAVSSRELLGTYEAQVVRALARNRPGKPQARGAQGPGFAAA